jgi:hypothetical protein
MFLMLCVSYAECHNAEYFYAQCHQDECHYALCHSVTENSFFSSFGEKFVQKSAKIFKELLPPKTCPRLAANCLQ